MLYRKIQLEVVVLEDEADAVVSDLNRSLDQLDEKHTLFGGAIETTAFEHTGIPRRSALAHTLAAGETVQGALKTARQGLSAALRTIR